MVTHQLQIRCRLVKVRRSETDVLPLSHPTNPIPWLAVVERNSPLAGKKLYCLVTEAHVCEQLAQGRYVKVELPWSNLWRLDCKSDSLTITPPLHTRSFCSFFSSISWCPTDVAWDLRDLLVTPLLLIDLDLPTNSHSSLQRLINVKIRLFATDFHITS